MHGLVYTCIHYFDSFCLCTVCMYVCMYVCVFYVCVVARKSIWTLWNYLVFTSIDTHYVPKPIPHKQIPCIYWTLNLLNTVLVEKVSEPLELITGQTSFGSKKLKRALWVSADQTCRTFRRNCRLFCPTELFQLSYILRFFVWCEQLSTASLLG